jgi:predicted glutamine amidotransferase
MRRRRSHATVGTTKGARMCRWLAYSGSPLPLDAILYKPQHSLIDQSLHSKLGAETTNGDGFGIGWYTDVTGSPGVYRSIEPAWNDRNLRELASHLMSPVVFAHIRAAIGSAVQATNCHPFRHGRWLFMHNGFIGEFGKVRRDLVLAIDPSLFPLMEGSADTEVMFYLALTFGLDDDPVAAMEATVGLIEEVGRKHGVEQPIQMTVATTNGESIWAFRYSSERNSRSLFYTTAVETVRELHPELDILELVNDETRLIVSEPLRDLPGVWNAVPESSWGVVQPGQDEIHAFTPKAPVTSVALPV